MSNATIPTLAPPPNAVHRFALPQRRLEHAARRLAGDLPGLAIDQILHADVVVDDQHVHQQQADEKDAVAQALFLMQQQTARLPAKATRR